MKGSSRTSPELLRTALPAALLTFGILAAVHTFLRTPLLLADRFVRGLGLVEALLLGIYSGAVAYAMADPKAVPRWRLRLWALFSLFFFGQLVLGLLGISEFLMTGKLHLPVPAMIVAGPLYRRAIHFMPYLFLGTTVLVGPAWCSHLCYFGVWDGVASNQVRRPRPMPEYRLKLQVLVLCLVVGVAFLLGMLGASSVLATALGLAFGLAGLGVILVWSRRTGQMVHCTVWCPIGLVATFLGKVSPFRLRIDKNCNFCWACTRACRYDALRPEHIRARKPGNSCTLCGDCLRTCHGRFIEYRFLWLRSATARRLFLVLVVGIHGAFLGLARI